MFDTHKVEIEWGGRPLTLETGKVARQADGAVIASYGETTVLATVVSAKSPKPRLLQTEKPTDLAVLVSLLSKTPTRQPALLRK